MPQLGKASLERLSTCDQRLQDIIHEVIKHFDCTVTCGHRNEADQEEAFRTGKSTVQFPNSKHNSLPSMAIDVVPYPVDWNDLKRFYYFAGFVMATAASKGIKLRFGGDWNGDTQVKDNNFNDLPHFEILE